MYSLLIKGATSPHRTSEEEEEEVVEKTRLNDYSKEKE
jgi:hypothetical protein